MTIIRKITFVGLPFCLLLLGEAVQMAHAAPITWTANTNVSITSPAATLTIASGSVADVFTANATSVVATLSSSTGGSFTLTSGSSSLSVASSSAGGTVSQSCTSGVASTTISQSSASSSYTITPTGSPCAITISSVNASVSGNGATITWTTNYAASDVVSYGTTSSYGSTASGSGGTTSHSVSLSGLSYSTTYHYSVSSVAGTTNASSSDATFTVGAAPSSGGGGGGGGGGGSAYTIAINGGVSTAASTNVSLSLYGTMAYQMEISNGDPTFASSTWIPYVTTMSWALLPTSSLQTIYVRYQAIGGTIVGSAQASITVTGAIGTSSVVSTTVASIPSVSSQSPQALLAALMAQLQALTAQANRLGVPLPSGASSVASPAIAKFTSNLTIGSKGNDVASLQQILINKNSGPYAQQLAAKGATGYFGSLTKKALIEFQNAVGIVPATGFFGQKTRIYLRTH